MDDREMPQMHKYGESKTHQIMLATVCHVTSCLGQKILGLPILIFDEQRVQVYDIWNFLQL